MSTASPWASWCVVYSLSSRHASVKLTPGQLQQTELHPLLQPTLLGLNTNAGEKVSLRLLTDRLDGTRSYNEVRKVLLHELAHNRHGDQCVSSPPLPLAQLPSLRELRSPVPDSGTPDAF